MFCFCFSFVYSPRLFEYKHAKLNRIIFLWPRGVTRSNSVD